MRRSWDWSETCGSEDDDGFAGSGGKKQGRQVVKGTQAPPRLQAYNPCGVHVGMADKRARYPLAIVLEIDRMASSLRQHGQDAFEHRLSPNPVIVISLYHSRTFESDIYPPPYLMLMSSP